MYKYTGPRRRRGALCLTAPLPWLTPCRRPRAFCLSYERKRGEKGEGGKVRNTGRLKPMGFPIPRKENFQLFCLPRSSQGGSTCCSCTGSNNRARKTDVLFYWKNPLLNTACTLRTARLRLHGAAANAAQTEVHEINSAKTKDGTGAISWSSEETRRISGTETQQIVLAQGANCYLPRRWDSHWLE